MASIDAYIFCIISKFRRLLSFSIARIRWISASSSLSYIAEAREIAASINGRSYAGGGEKEVEISLVIVFHYLEDFKKDLAIARRSREGSI